MNPYDGAIHDGANADIGRNREDQRVVRIEVTSRYGPTHVLVLTVDAAIALRNHLDSVFDAAGIDDGDAATSAPNDDLLEAATAALRLWNKHGLGDSDAESEPAHQALVNAIARAKGLI